MATRMDRDAVELVLAAGFELEKVEFMGMVAAA
jgi:hypothetical protein